MIEASAGFDIALCALLLRQSAVALIRRFRTAIGRCVNSLSTHGLSDRCWLGRRGLSERGRVRLLHEVLPDLRGQRAAGNLLHRAVIVVADPDPDHERVAEADEPGIAIILARSGLAGREV